MDNKELLKKAVEAEFDSNQCARVTASDSKEAVQLPRDIEALTRLEKTVPTLESIDNEFAFHYWLVRA